MTHLHYPLSHEQRQALIRRAHAERSAAVAAMFKRLFSHVAWLIRPRAVKLESLPRPRPMADANASTP
jgi:hypothetical protein